MAPYHQIGSKMTIDRANDPKRVPAITHENAFNEGYDMEVNKEHAEKAKSDFEDYGYKASYKGK